MFGRDLRSSNLWMGVGVLLTLGTAVGCGSNPDQQAGKPTTTTALLHSAAILNSLQHDRSKPLPSDIPIAELIQDLNQVRVTTSANPGGVWFNRDPIYEAIVAKGNDAVEPLIDAYANDDRSTGDVFPKHSDREPDQPVMACYVAYRALRQILQFDDVFGTTYRPKPEELRAFWKANKNIAPEERWFRTLADDSAEPQRWADAAHRLVDPENVRREGAVQYSVTSAPGQSAPPMHGEMLRSRTNPSLTDLMIRRTRQLAGLDPISGENPRRTNVSQM